MSETSPFPCLQYDIGPTECFKLVDCPPCPAKSCLAREALERGEKNVMHFACPFSDQYEGEEHAGLFLKLIVQKGLNPNDVVGY